MNLSEKKTLYKLLNEYMADLLNLDEENFRRRKDREDHGWNLNNCRIMGVKAQFNHARCISRKLELDIEQNMMT